MYGVNNESQLGEVWAEEREEEKEKEVYVPSMMYCRRMRHVGTNKGSPFVFCVFESFLEDDEGEHREVRFVPEVLKWKGQLVILGGLHDDDMARECPMPVYNVLNEEVVAILAGLRPSNFVHCAVVALYNQSVLVLVRRFTIDNTCFVLLRMVVVAIQQSWKNA